MLTIIHYCKENCN